MMSTPHEQTLAGLRNSLTWWDKVAAAIEEARQLDPESHLRPYEVPEEESRIILEQLADEVLSSMFELFEADPRRFLKGVAEGRSYGQTVRETGIDLFDSPDKVLPVRSGGDSYAIAAYMAYCVEKSKKETTNV